MLSKDNKILEFNQYQRSDKALLIIYADVECFIEKIAKFKNKVFQNGCNHDYHFIIGIWIFITRNLKVSFSV